MRRFVRSAMRGQLGRYLQFLTLLLLAGGGALYVTALTGCDDCTPREPEVKVSREVQREPATTQSMRDAAGLVAAEVVDAWHVVEYIYASPAFTVTHAQCQDWADFLQSEDTFVGFRAPYTEPVILTHPQSATLRLLHYEGGPPIPVMTGTLEYRPERADFMQNNLPAGTANEFWVPLGLVTSPTSTCPAGDLPFGMNGDGVIENELNLNVFLDMDANERVLPIYLCYEGQNGPPGVSAADLALARVAGALGGVGALGFQEQGITCLGPHYEPLKETFFGPMPGEWEIHGPLFTTITRTQTISLELEAQEDINPGTVTLTFVHSSDLGAAVNWGLYHDAAGSQPITAGNPLVADGPSPGTPFYAIADVPGNSTAPDPGPYSLVMTASRQADGSQFVHSVLFWMGAWTSPPGGGRDLFLPLVTKN